MRIILIESQLTTWNLRVVSFDQDHFWVSDNVMLRDTEDVLDKPEEVAYKSNVLAKRPMIGDHKHMDWKHHTKCHSIK